MHLLATNFRFFFFLHDSIHRYRIGPFEVESALIEHPAVAESAVVSSPDPTRGEVSHVDGPQTKCSLNTNQINNSRG